jgi:IclR family acetate operon transcriptional repressor
LTTLAEAGDGATLTDLAAQVGLAPSTTHRLLNTLERESFVHQDPEQGRWYVSVKAFQVGNAFLNSRDVVARARPHLQQLMEASGETVNLAVPDQGEAVMMAQVQCHEMMRMLVPLGSRAPMHASGVGKALMSTLPEAEVACIIQQRGLNHYTDSTFDNPGELRAELAKIRTAGWAYDNEEHAVGLRCVAAPIHDEHGRSIAAVSISGPRSRVSSARIRELGEMVARTAGLITHSIGGTTPTGTDPETGG